LSFRYPTQAERNLMQTVNRDMSKAEQERRAKRRNNFAEIIESLDSGESTIDDYPEDLMAKLAAYLAKKSKRGKR